MASKDRLKELRNLPVVPVLPVRETATCEIPTRAHGYDENDSPSSVEPTILHGVSNNKFHVEIEGVKQLLDTFKRSISGMESLLAQRRWNIEDENDLVIPSKQSSTSSISSASSIENDLSLIISEINRLATDVRSRFKRLKLLIAEEKDVGEQKTEQGILNALLSQFVHLVERYNKIHNDYKSKCRQRCKRTASIILPEATEEQLEEMVDTGKIQTMVYDKIMADQRTAEARAALFLMQEQQRDLIALEKNIGELHSLFVDVYSIMAAQEDSLQAINSELSEAIPRIEHAVSDLREAEKLVKRRRGVVIATVATITTIGLIATAAALAPLLAFA